MRNRYALGLMALLAGTSTLALTGCGDDDETPGPTPVTTGLRLAHAATDAPAVDLYLSGSATPFATNVAYGQTTAYVELAPGDYAIDVRAAGAAATVPALYTSPTISIADGVRFTTIAAGNVASTDADDSFRVLVFDEAFGVPAGSNARARAVNAGFESPTIDMNIGNDGGTPEIEGLARFAASDPSGFDLPSATSLQIGVESEDGAALSAFTTPVLAAGSQMFLITTGLTDLLPREQAAFSLLPVNQDSGSSFVLQNPTLYSFNASPDAGAVDVFAGEVEVADNMEFGDLEHIQLPPGTYTLDFFAAEPGPSERPTTDPLASAPTPNLVAGQSYLSIAAGELLAAAPTFQVITIAEQFALDDQDNARVRAVNASAGAPAIDFAVVQTPGEMQQPALITDLSFAESTEAQGLSVPPEDVLLGVAPTGDTETAAEFAAEPSANERAFVIAAGNFEGLVNGLQLFSIDTTQSPWTVTELPEE